MFLSDLGISLGKAVVPHVHFGRDTKEVPSGTASLVPESHAGGSPVHRHDSRSPSSLLNVTDNDLEKPSTPASVSKPSTPVHQPAVSQFSSVIVDTSSAPLSVRLPLLTASKEIHPPASQSNPVSSSNSVISVTSASHPPRLPSAGPPEEDINDSDQSRNWMNLPPLPSLVCSYCLQALLSPDRTPMDD